MTSSKFQKIIIAIIIYIIILFLFIWYENFHVVTTYYVYKNNKITSDLDGYRIIQISDFHNADFGNKNKELIEKIKKLTPNLIVLTGDFINSYNVKCDIVLDFIKNLCEICPVYYVTGNHEFRMNIIDRQKLFENIEKCGATNLDNKINIIFNKNSCFKLIGLSDKHLKDKTLEHLVKKCKNTELKILLAHEPQYVNNYVTNKIDLILAGHAHGGQIRIPFIGALFAPGQGVFPKYTAGNYNISETTTMIVSRGIGNSSFPIRVFNKPELVCIELKS